MIALVARFVVALLADGAAFIIWDIGTRPFGTLMRDIGGSFGRPGALARGILRLLAGMALLLLGALETAPAAVDQHTFTIIETGLLVGALLVETLIGSDLRRSLGKRAD
jgi:hypothetical protein